MDNMYQKTDSRYTSKTSFVQDVNNIDAKIDPSHSRFPYCIVWTPIPLLTWLFPLIGHMGIAYSNGVIRDFAGSYFVSEDDMAFGKPTKYWKLNPNKANPPGAHTWDQAIVEASQIYCNRTHNLICDNCHSHVATALDRMEYNNSKNWNMVKLAFGIVLFGKYVNFTAFCKTWLPFVIIVTFIICISYFG